MATKRSSGQYELVLENRQLVFIFFGAALLCGVFFALGFLIGRDQGDLRWRSASGKLEGIESSQASVKTSPKKNDTGAEPPITKTADQDAISKELSFYKTVEGKSKEAEYKVNPVGGARSADKSSGVPKAATPAAAVKIVTTTPATQPAGATIIFQVAALSKSVDAEALVRKLKAKGFQAFFVSPPPDAGADKLYRVQVGPFSEAATAEQVKSKLLTEGYQPLIRR